jgi:hypothetical protein
MQIDTINMAEINSFKNVVKWLEIRKIRFYAPEDRVKLDDLQDSGWTSTFASYVSDLGGASNVCVKTTEDRIRVLDWLLSYAIGMEYSDRVDELQKVQPMHQIENQKKAQQDTEKLKTAARTKIEEDDVKIELDVDSPEFVENLNKLAHCLGVPKDDSKEAMLRACAAILEQKFSARAIELHEKEKVFPIFSAL